MNRKRFLTIVFWGSVILLTIGVIWSVCYFPYFLKVRLNAKSITGLGEYGDIYGGLNTLFTGLAFVGLVVTILLQHQELKETRDEFEKQTKQFEEQTHLLSVQTEEQKAYNREQKELMTLQQKKDDVYRRLEYLSKLEDNVVLNVYEAQFAYIGQNGPEYKIVLRETEKGTLAMEKIYLFSEILLMSMGTEQTPDKTANLSAHIKSLFLARSKFLPWLQCFCDLVTDVQDYFSSSHEDMEKYYRLIFNSCTQEKIGLIYLFCNVEVDAPLVEMILKNKMFGIKVEGIISHSNFEKELLKQAMHQRLDFDEVQELWRQKSKV